MLTVPGRFLSILILLHDLVFTANLWRKFQYYSQFPDNETEAQIGTNIYQLIIKINWVAQNVDHKKEKGKIIIIQDFKVSGSWVRKIFTHIIYFAWWSRIIIFKCWKWTSTIYTLKKSIILNLDLPLFFSIDLTKVCFSQLPHANWHEDKDTL